MNSFQGKRILFIAPRFFRYEDDIAQELRSRGAEVDYVPDRPFDSPAIKAVTRFARPLVISAANAFYRRELGRLGRSGYDIVLVVNGQTVSTPVLRELRAAYPRAQFILYMWDSFRNRSSAVSNLRFFDRLFSFDPDSAREFGLGFRPLFFSSGFNRPESGTFDIHLSFVGTCHTDRYSVTSGMASSLPKGHVFFRYLYLQAPWVYYAYRLGNPAFRGSSPSDFHFRPMPREAVLDTFNRSRAILDIEHPRQTGLTIRTLETIGSSRKLVTTNPRVREYDFHHPENVCVIDRRAPRLPEGFLEGAFRPLEPAIRHKYSIRGWVDDVVAGGEDGFLPMGAGLSAAPREQRGAGR